MSLAIGFSPTNIGFLPTDYRIIAHQLTGFYPLVLSGYHPPQWGSKVRHYWVVENVTRARVLAFLIRFNTQQEFATLIPVKISQNQTSRGEGCSACYTSTVLKLLNIQHTPNALIKKEEFAIYYDKNVKATLSHDERLAHITEVIN